ncbi:MAG: recombinase-like helix-turn-helix domain-containing protein [Alphaproteobacteria bacterium]
MELYQEAWQVGSGKPSAHENALADALEAAFAAGHRELDAIVSALNRSGVAAPDGVAWTVALFEAEMRRLGA